MVPAPTLTFLPTLASPIYDKWLIFEFFPILLFFISTKFPTREPLDNIEPGLILEKGPTFTFDSKVAFSICVKDKISTLFPIFGFSPITTYGFIVTFFPNYVSCDKNTVSGDFIVTPIYIAWLRNFSCLYFSAKAIFFLFIDVIKISLYININFVITHKIFLNNTY